MKEKILSNFFWRFAERCGAQAIQFFVSIVLARILAPEAYGRIALLLVFSNILQVFVDSGLANALIQKKDADDLDFSSVFYFNIIFCFILYSIVYICSPFIAKFYQDDNLIILLRVLSITIIISGFKNVQQAYVSRTMQFKKFFWATLGGTVLSAIIGVGLAVNGAGVWALVAQRLVNMSVDTLVLWFTVKWYPKLMFSWERLKGLLYFGWKLLLSALIDTVYSSLRNLIIGKIYTSADLAFYNQGDKFPNVIVSNINSSIDSVLLPSMSSVQDDSMRVKYMTRRAMKTSVYVMAPLMMGLTFCAPSIVRLVLTDKWLACVPFLRIFCITYMFWPVHTANLNAIKAMGRSDLILKLEIIKKIIGLILLFSTMYISVQAMAYSLLLSCVLSQIINSWPNRKLLDYGYLEQLKDVLPAIVLAVVMGGCIYFVQLFNLSDGLIVCIQVLLGAGIYVGASRFFKLEAYIYILDILVKTIHKRQKGNEEKEHE